MKQDAPGGPLAADPAAAERWLLLLLQLPTRPSRARVQTWRRLQRLGAVALKSAAYVLPNTPQAREDFEWMKREIVGFNGQATVLAARSIDDAEDEAIVAAFREARRGEFDEVIRALDKLRRSLGKAGAGRRTAAAVRGARELRRWRERLEQIQEVDFFGAPNAMQARTAIDEIERRLSGPPSESPARQPGVAKDAYRGRTWVTRPRPRIDRLASAWLIRRFIDSQATFEFSGSLPAPESRRIPYDMFDAEFSHHGGACTFEVLAARFGVDDPAVAHIGRIVHDIDLKDAKFGAPEAPTIAALVDGLGAAYHDDAELLEHGVVLFEGLYRSLRQGHGDHRGHRDHRKRKP